MGKQNYTLRFGILMCMVAVFSIVSGYSDAFAQEMTIENTDIAGYYTIEGTSIVAGDLIAHDVANDVYHRAITNSDSEFFGVVVFDPVLFYQTQTATTATNTLPIAESGTVPVNVTDLNGDISRGDGITTSPAPGFGQRARAGDESVIGVAHRAFPTEATALATTTLSDGTVVRSGRILVRLGEQSGDADGRPEFDIAGVSEVTLLNVLQYLAATAVAVGTIYISFRNFGGNLREAVLSIGRNPRARASIHRVVIFNTVLIVVTTLLGLFVSFAIISISLL